MTCLPGEVTGALCPQVLLCGCGQGTGAIAVLDLSSGDPHDPREWLSLALLCVVLACSTAVDSGWTPWIP